METFKYILRRVLQMIPVFIVSLIVIFLMMRLLPGDAALATLGEKVDPKVYEALKENMGLNASLWDQFTIYASNLLQGDLGSSYKYKMPVAELIGSRMVVTLCLALTAAIITIIVALPLGYLAGVKKDKLPDVLVRLFALVGLAAPSFWVGLVLLITLAVGTGLFPTSGWGKDWGEHLWALLLPGFTLAFASIAVVIRNVRNNVVDVRNADYVDFGRSKGLSSWVISTGYVLRNALIPTATLLALRIIGMLSGSVIIENIFGLPGIGALLVEAVTGREYATVQGCVMVFVAITLIVNLLTDILYSVLDHRIQLGGDRA
ncbi:MAG: ABC transporter permease [Coriobacteriales bacterium]|nr:ABC transporter permease [Coriobacteriales bacterium]